MHLLLVGAERGDGRPDVVGTEHGNAPRRIDPGELGVAGEGVDDAEAAAADLDRPLRCSPPGLAELALEVGECFPLLGVAPPMAVAGDDRLEDRSQLGGVRVCRRGFAGHAPAASSMRAKSSSVSVNQAASRFSSA